MDGLIYEVPEEVFLAARGIVGKLAAEIAGPLYVTLLQLQPRSAPAPTVAEIAVETEPDATLGGDR